MDTATVDLLPTAEACKIRMVEAEAQKASEWARKVAEAEAEKRELLKRLQESSGVSDEERIKRASAIIKRAVENGKTDVLVGRFSNKLCTDGGRAINQQEPGWENTLLGLPKELLEFWRKYLQPRGYRIKFEIVDWPGGLPGDIGITLMWG
jgi:hypothetical protein